MITPVIKSINYYSWEGDACRVIEDVSGNITADIYRGGKGLLSVNPTDVTFNGSKINELQYKELVREEIALSRKKTDS
jgi:hypothetical protein